MIPEPHPYDPDDPSYDDFGIGDLGLQLPDGAGRADRIDPLDPNEY
ncbi:MAG TPA: hypothetical protein VIT43_13905 [Candidatus Dormibacteraeota bacterium]|jgi:hypothetical protein